MSTAYAEHFIHAVRVIDEMRGRWPEQIRVWESCLDYESDDDLSDRVWEEMAAAQSWADEEISKIGELPFLYSAAMMQTDFQNLDGVAKRGFREACIRASELDAMRGSQCPTVDRYTKPLDRVL